MHMDDQRISDCSLKSSIPLLDGSFESGIPILLCQIKLLAVRLQVQDSHLKTALPNPLRRDQDFHRR